MPTTATLSPSAFAAKWRGATTTEKAAAHEHFIDICRLLGEATPHEADPTGESYAFERRVTKAQGGDGYADVWKRDFFAWEYKGHRANLRAAYAQLLDYKDDLGNPPLLVVSDLDTIEIRTNYTGLSPVVKTVTLDDLASNDPSSAMALLRDVFIAPEALRPRIEPAQITEKAARHFAEIAQSLRERGHENETVARFLDRMLFCLFAEDAGLLPRGIFHRLADVSRGRSDLFASALRDLFGKMSDHGGLFGAEEIEWFGGDLFDSDDVLTLTGNEINTILEVSRLNWAKVEPAIFGTLFERGLDPDRRAQLGAHYTDRDAIWNLVEPVVLRPLRREFVAMQSEVGQIALGITNFSRPNAQLNKANRAFQAFLERLRKVRILDPACGSGNFLVVALEALKELEYEAIQWGSLVLKQSMQIPQIGPEAVLGIEVNGYAAELARVTVWISYLQWTLRKGIPLGQRPILRRLDHIETRDALLLVDDSGVCTEAEWPDADFIVGNPPFLGNRLFRRGLGDQYTDALRRIFDDRIPHSSDLACYWHEKARAAIERKRTARAGLLATQSIRSHDNRKVLERINESGQIFFARSDEPWVLAGATVHISFVGQDDGREQDRTLDGVRVPKINADLTAGTDVTTARRLAANLNLAFMGDIKVGPFDIPADTAKRMLAQQNPDGRTNSDVIRPWANAADLVGIPRGMWIVDFGVDMPMEEAALYEAPFEYVREVVKPFRMSVKAECCRAKWWLHHNPRPAMRTALRPLGRFIATPRVSKHRIFTWLSTDVLLDSAAVAIASDSDYVLGVLQSRVHEIWARALGSQLREAESGFRYTSSTTFETFPFPVADQQQIEKVELATKRLMELRGGWIRAGGSADDVPRTLTALYNDSPSWLRNVHEDLDRAVLEIY